ncbi:hypothetical protein ACFPN0_03105 [Kitasatospora cinereorecta]
MPSAGPGAEHHGVTAARQVGLPACVEVIGLSPARHRSGPPPARARAVAVGDRGESPSRGERPGSAPHKLPHLSTVPVHRVPTGARAAGATAHDRDPDRVPAPAR